MIVKHNKTGNLYQLIDDECKSKINGKWVDAVIYKGKDKETGKIKYFAREKSDFDRDFTAVHGNKSGTANLWFEYHIGALKRIAAEYPGKTIENVIAQMESRRKEIGNSAAK